MAMTTLSTYEIPLNPVDVAETLISANDWAFNRTSDEELLVEISGRWSDYHLYFLWRADVSALYFSLTFDMRVPAAKVDEVLELLSRVNEKMWIGHFDFMSDDSCLMFRHTLPLRGMDGTSLEQIEDLVDAAVIEADRFFPAFQYLVWGGRPAKEALEMSLFETIGEA